MDPKTLNVLKIFTNYGFRLGFSPYQFIDGRNPSRNFPATSLDIPISSFDQNSDENSTQMSQVSNNNWYGPQNETSDEDENEEETVNPKKSKSNKATKIMDKQNKISNKNQYKNFFKTKGIRKKYDTIFKTGAIQKQEKHDVQNQFSCPWRFAIGESKFRWLMYIFSMILQVIYILFLIFRSIQSLFNDNESTKDKIKIFYLTGILTTLFCFQMMVFRFYGQHSVYLNAVTDTLAQIENLYKSNQQQGQVKGQEEVKGHSMRIFLYAELLLITFVPLIRASNVFRNPRSKLVLTSLAESPEKLPFWVKILAALFHFQVSGFSAYVTGFCCTTLLWYVVAVLPVIEKTRILAKPEKEEEHQQMSRENLLLLYKIYNRLSILQNNFKTVYGAVTLIEEYGTIYIVVLNIFLAVVHGQISGLVRAVAVSYLARVIFSLLAEMHGVSQKTINSWKRNVSCRAIQKEQNRNDADFDVIWFSKFVKSLRPLRIYVGDFFYVDKKFSLTLAGIIIEMTASFLLSIKN